MSYYVKIHIDNTIYVYLCKLVFKKWSTYNYESQQNRKNGYDEDVRLLEDWNDFCANSQLKLYKDRKGHKYIVDITSSSSQVADETREQATTVNVGWTQIGDADNYVIIGD